MSAMNGSEYYVVRECQGKVFKRSRFFGIESVSYWHSMNLFGAWFVGPFRDRDAALMYSLPGHRRDRAVPASELDPVLQDILREHRTHDGRRETYLSASELADLPRLLSALREIWTTSSRLPNYTTGG